MSPPPAVAPWRARLRPFRAVIAVGLVYVVARLAFSSFSPIEGLVTPSGPTNIVAALLGLVALVLRLVALFLLPPIVAYRLATMLWKRRV